MHYEQNLAQNTRFSQRLNPFNNYDLFKVYGWKGGTDDF